MFKDDIYQLMFDNEEMWYIFITGSAYQIADCSLMDN